VEYPSAYRVFSTVDSGPNHSSVEHIGDQVQR